MDASLEMQMKMDETTKALESLGERWADIVCPIFVDSSKKLVTAQGIGTCFVASNRDALYLITAHHVIRDSRKHSVRVTNLRGIAYDTSHLDFSGDEKNDIVYAQLDKGELSQLGVASLKHYSLSSVWEGWRRTTTYFLLGYPASKNELKLTFGKTDRHCLNLFATSAQRRRCKTAVEDPIFLSYSPKRVTDRLGTNIRPPNLFGMSGGPCFQVMAKETELGVTFAPRLVGVIVEWYPENHTIIASPIEHVYGYRPDSSA